MAEEKKVDLPEVDDQGRAIVRLADGTGKYVKFNNRAVKLLEKELGINFFTFLSGDDKSVQEKFSFTTICAFLWAGIKGAAKDNRFTVDDVCDLIDIRKLDQYVTPIFAAIRHYTGGDKQSEDPPEQQEDEDPLRPTGAPMLAPEP